MSNPIASLPLRIHANTRHSFFEQVKNCFDAVTQCVIDVFKKIGEFFYNLFHAKPKPTPTSLVEVLQPVIENPPVPVAEVNRAPVENGPNAAQQQPIVNQRPPNQPSVNTQRMIAFYQGEARIDGVSSLNDILTAENEYLDDHDDWIWAFPTQTLNFTLPIGPPLDAENFQTLLKDPIVRENILKVFKRVLAYLGLQLNNENQIEKAHNFDERAKYWITYNNYNYRRITRILHSLGDMQLFGDLSPDREGYDRKLFRCLDKIFLENEAQIGFKLHQDWWFIVFK